MKIIRVLEKMISSNQIRAARGLLNLSQREAADGCGISLTTLSGIEGGNTQPSHDTGRKLQEFFEGCGIEFTDGDGVRRQVGETVYRGQEGMRRFYADVYETARRGTDICIFNGVPDLLIKWAGKDYYFAHSVKMTVLQDRTSVRAIVEEGETNLIGTSFAKYKTIASALFHDKTFYIYGDKVAFFAFAEDTLTIRVMPDADIAASMRVLFNFAWDAADDVR